MSSCGVAIPTGRELAFNQNAGPIVNLTLYDRNPAVCSMVFLDGASRWNSRLVRLSGQAILISNTSGVIQEDFVPRGNLVTMWTWARDHLLMDVSERSKFLWSNTIFFPVYKFNLLDPLVLNVREAVHYSQVRSIQNTSNHLPFYIWFFTPQYPLPLVSDSREGMNAGTKTFLAQFSAKIDKKASKENPIAGRSEKSAKGSEVENAVGETVTVGPKEPKVSPKSTVPSNTITEPAGAAAAKPAPLVPPVPAAQAPPTAVPAATLAKT